MNNALGKITRSIIYNHLIERRFHFTVTNDNDPDSDGLFRYGRKPDIALVHGNSRDDEA